VLDASVADTENLANYFLEGQHGSRLGRLAKKSSREQDTDFISVKASLEQWITLVHPLAIPLYCLVLTCLYTSLTPTPTILKLPTLSMPLLSLLLLLLPNFLRFILLLLLGTTLLRHLQALWMWMRTML
jgi:hypothetical protein